VDNYNYNNRGERDEFILPALDLSAAASATMTFDLSYVLYSQSGFSDTLLVYGSTDCGNTWSNLYTKYDQALTTVTPYYMTAAFTPSNAAQWRNESVNLASLVGSSSVLIKVVNATDYENNLYIDNINIAASTVAIDESVLDAAVSVAPNPSNGQFKVSINLPAAADLQLSVFDVVGKQIAGRDLTGFSSGSFDFDLSSKASGVYFLRVTSENRTIVKKISIR
jgi:hypothetical protein